MKSNAILNDVWEIQHIKNGKVFKTEYKHNIITDLSLNEWADALVGTATDIEIKFMGLGTNTTTPTPTDTQLRTEVFRMDDIALDRVATGQTRSEFLLADDEALFAIKELGVFCGSTATASFNTGLMLSRILWDIDRTSGATEIRFIRHDTLERK